LANRIVEYTWRPFPTDHFGLRDYPVAGIFLKNAEGKWKFKQFLVDSAADVTAINKVAAEELGIEPIGEAFSINQSTKQGINVYKAKVDINFNGVILENVNIVLVINNNLRMPLLGRLDVFDYFDVNLQARNKKTVLTH
jgi:predicted aspartyl protease